MQQTLPRPESNNWLTVAFERLVGFAKRQTPAVAHGDVKFTDQMERELAEREYRHWR